MGIFEDCLNAGNHSRYRGAKVDAIINSLPPKDKESLIAALDEPSISHEKIAHVLAQRGISISKDAIRLWRIAHTKKDS